MTKLLRTLFSLLSFTTVSFTQLSVAQTTTAPQLPAARITGAATSASFTLGLSRSNGATFETTALTTDSIRLIGTIAPETAQIGQPADIYVVAALGSTFFMRNQAGDFVPWNGAVPSLVPYRSGQTLSGTHPVDFLTGAIPITGTFQLFMGYKANDGVLIYTPQPHTITINTPAPPPPPPPPPPPTKTIREQAVEAYNTNISNQIVQSFCTACHIQGGVASGTDLRFVTSNNSNHLNMNFTAFENMVKSRGRAYILSNVRGQSEHTKPASGGVVLPSTSNDYKNLDTFLQLVEQL